MPVLADWQLYAHTMPVLADWQLYIHYSAFISQLAITHTYSALTDNHPQALKQKSHPLSALAKHLYLMESFENEGKFKYK